MASIPAEVTTARLRLPVITPTEARAMLGGHRELVTDGLTGVLFPPDDPAACAASLGALLARASEWPAMRDMARAHVAAHHDWQRNVHRYRDVYRALLEPAGKARVRAA